MFWAKFHITSQGMQKHQIFISSVVKMDLGQNSTFEAKECRNIKPLSVCSYKFIFGQILHNKPRDAGTSNLYQFARRNLFLAKFHITSQGMQEHRTFISSILNINFEPNSTFPAKECRNIKPLSVRSSKLIWS